MQNLLKKSLALIMAAIMLLAAVPFASYVGLDLNITASAAKAKLIKSGNCGDKGSNVKYKLYDNGLLEISGKGEMNYSFGEAPPYGTYVARQDKYGYEYYVENTVKKVIIKSGITLISPLAFISFEKLQEVEMADTVTTIGQSAFASCSALNKLKLSKGLKSISNSAFSSCTSLKEVTIPDSVEYIGAEAFINCTKLSKIVLSTENIEEISPNVFLDTKFYNTSSNWKNGVLYIGKTLIAAKPKVVSGTYRIKNGTKVIADMAFSDCTKIKNIVIPNSVVLIGTSAFFYCDKLSKITIPDTVKKIGYSILFETAYYKNKSNWENGLLYIGKKLLDSDYELTGDLAIKDGTNVISVGCFNSSHITSIVIPDSITEIPDETFWGCSDLKSVSLPNTVKRIGTYAFCECNSLKTINLPASLMQIDDNTFIDSGIKTLTIPKGVTEIGETIFGYENTKKNKNYTIKGYKNTTAEEYAKENGYKFVSLGTHKHSLKTTKLTKATLTKDGQLVRTCTGCRKTFQTTIRKVSTVKLSKTAYTYTGKVITPSVIVKDSSGKTLKKDQDYTVKYAEGRKKPGTYKVKVTLKGNYSGSKTLSFKITAKK